MKHWFRSPIAWVAGGVTGVLLIASLAGNGQGGNAAVRLASPSVAVASTAPMPNRPELWQGRINYALLDQRIAALMQKPAMAGMAVAVVENGRLSFVQGYGYADRETGVQVDENTLFRWASVSKGVAGTLAYKLAEQGRLNLALPIAAYGTTLRLPTAAERRLTVTDVLAHRVGIAHNAYDGQLEDGGDPRLIRASLGALGLQCEPGDCHTYQNVAYDAVSEVISQATGKSYPALVESELFEQLGMTSAGLGMTHLTNAKTWAKPYRGLQARPLSEAYFRVPAAAGVSSNIVDLARWMQAHMGEQPEILSPAVLREVHRPRVATDRRGGGELRAVTSDHSYGQGWRSFNYDGHWLVGHSGAVDGYRATILFDPALRSGVVMLWNSTDTRPFKLQYEILDQLYGREFYDWLDLGKPVDVNASSSAD